MAKMQPTGVTGMLIEGNYARAVTIYDTDTGFVVIDRSSGTPAPGFDPMLSQWLTQRAVSSAAAKLGTNQKLSLIRLTKDLVAKLKEDPKVAVFTTEQFVRKMDPKRADTILMGLSAFGGGALVDEAEDLAEAV